VKFKVGDHVIIKFDQYGWKGKKAVINKILNIKISGCDCTIRYDIYEDIYFRFEHLQLDEAFYFNNKFEELLNE